MIRVLAMAILLCPGTAAAGCRLALVLALDVSGSVDVQEYRQQLHGVADALQSAAVTRALLSEPGRPVALTVFEWSGARFQRVVLPWTMLTDRAAIDAVAARLRMVERVAAPRTTGIGGALLAGVGAMARGPACDRQVIDVSGDGINNDWPPPEQVRAKGALLGIIVNGLVILPGPDGADPEGLEDYFRAQVLSGPGAFLETAAGYADYARAMARKLLRETEAPMLGKGQLSRGAVARRATVALRLPGAP